jgi:hypothetical protein
MTVKHIIKMFSPNYMLNHEQGIGDYLIKKGIVSQTSSTLMIGPGAFETKTRDHEVVYLPTDSGLIFLLSYLSSKTNFDVVDLPPEDNRGGSHDYVPIKELIDKTNFLDIKVPQINWIPIDIFDFSRKYKQIWDHNTWQWARNIDRHRDMPEYVKKISSLTSLGSKYIVFFDPDFSCLMSDPVEDLEMMKKLLSQRGFEISEVKIRNDSYPVPHESLRRILDTVETSVYCSGGFDLWDGTHLSALYPASKLIVAERTSS